MGFFPANSVGDDIEIYADEKREKISMTLHTLRQQTEKFDDKPYYAMSDFIAQKDSGRLDYIGGFAVTAGIGIEKLVAEYERNHDDYRSIMMKALADRLAEAFAERMHELVRKEYWGYAPNENCTHEDFIQGNYRGIRPAPGYPACPDHTEKPLLFKLIEAQKNTQITLTENFAMLPAASVCGFYFAHPDTRYFWLGQIARDQMEDYARRKNMPVDVLERWLAPHIGYK